MATTTSSGSGTVWLALLHLQGSYNEYIDSESRHKFECSKSFRSKGLPLLVISNAFYILVQLWVCCFEISRPMKKGKSYIFPAIIFSLSHFSWRPKLSLLERKWIWQHSARCMPENLQEKKRKCFWHRLHSRKYSIQFSPDKSPQSPEASRALTSFDLPPGSHYHYKLLICVRAFS